MTQRLLRLLLFLIPTLTVAAIISDHRPASAPTEDSHEKVLLRDIARKCV